MIKATVNGTNSSFPILSVENKIDQITAASPNKIIEPNSVFATPHLTAKVLTDDFKSLS